MYDQHATVALPEYDNCVGQGFAHLHALLEHLRGGSVWCALLSEHVMSLGGHSLGANPFVPRGRDGSRYEDEYDGEYEETVEVQSFRAPITKSSTLCCLQSYIGCLIQLNL